MYGHAGLFLLLLAKPGALAKPQYIDTKAGGQRGQCPIGAGEERGYKPDDKEDGDGLWHGVQGQRGKEIIPYHIVPIQQQLMSLVGGPIVQDKQV